MPEPAIAIWLTNAKKNIDWNSHEALLRAESDSFHTSLEPHPKHPLHPTYYHLTDAAAGWDRQGRDDGEPLALLRVVANTARPNASNPATTPATGFRVNVP